jgi:pimeloyl-ACP methyl ester carboxylesterase
MLPMELHVLTTEARVDRQRPPVILVHGAWHASWCWSEHWTGYLADRGYTTHALDLRGHGESPGSLRKAGIGSYVEDVRSVADALDENPIIVGHSMGGFVTQHYLMKHEARAGVLVASVPTHGAIPAAVRVAKRHPSAFARSNAKLNLGPIVDDHHRAKDLLFGPHLEDHHIERHTARLQDESYLAFVGMMFSLPRPKKVSNPMLVVGASHDRLFPPKSVEATAKAYGVDAKIFDGMGHNMMIDKGWDNVADSVVEFLDSV